MQKRVGGLIDLDVGAFRAPKNKTNGGGAFRLSSKQPTLHPPKMHVRRSIRKTENHDSVKGKTAIMNIFALRNCTL